MRNYVVTIAIMLSSIMAWGRVSLPAIISDNMVVQQDALVKLWGNAAPGETVSVVPSWNQAAGVRVVADSDGAWECRLATPAATIDRQTIEFRGKRNKVVVSNVLVGEVWLCTGQSNMVFPVGNRVDKEWWHSGMVDADEQLKNANRPLLRLFMVDEVISPDSVRHDCCGHWMVCSPETAYDFSAVGFVFGRRLVDELNVPVGMVQCARGATHVESWINPALMKDDPFFADVYELYGPQVKNLARPQFVPGCLWNGMVNPILGYTVRGNIWYQGEGNAPRFDRYQHAFMTLIDSWREEWGQPDMPFYFVQVAPLDSHLVPNPHGIREAQLDTWQSGLENIGMAVITDAGDPLDVHPRCKSIPGERLALWALAKDYGKDVAYAPPVYHAMRCDGDKIIVSFENADNGLSTSDGKDVKGFYVAGPDRTFFPADAVIDGNEVVVSSPEVRHPVAVRYGFVSYPDVNLCNKEGLPASPFRTDRWCFQPDAIKE